MRWLFTAHARLRMQMRGVTEEMVREAVQQPEGEGVGYGGRKLALRSYHRKTLKVVYTVEGDSPVIITVIWQ